MKYLILSPHQDDAALSVGGTLMSLSKKADLHLFTLCGISRFSKLSKLGSDANQVSKLRKKEDLLYSKFAGAIYSSGQLSDFEMSWVSEKKNGRKFDYIFSKPAQSAISKFGSEIQKFFNEVSPDVIFAPLGVGGHHDHMATHLACLQLFPSLKRKNRKLKLFFYEDLPYSAFNYLDIFARIRLLESAGHSLKSKTINIDKVIEKKLEGLKFFKSQDLEKLIPHIRRYAYLCGSERDNFEYFKERLWELVT